MDQRTEQARVVEVLVAVELQSDVEKHKLAAAFGSSANDAATIEEVVASILDPTRYKMYAGLAATVSDGRRVSTGTRDFGWGAPRQGLAAIRHCYRGPQLSDDPEEEVRLLKQSYRVGLADVQDAINAMLGRDPEQHRPPRLSWGNLLAALAAEAIEVTEEDLIASPLTLELSDEVKAEIAFD